jgi:hypothetical protein
MFHVHVELIGSKKVKGIRALVYQIAVKFGGFYVERIADSIYYQGDDLIINLLFSTAENCLQFENHLDENLQHYLLLGLSHIHLARRYPEIRLPRFSPPNGVFVRDYNSKDSTSENYSIAITRVTHVTFKTTIEEETLLLMIEDPNHDDFIKLRCYCAHLLSQAEYPDEKENINNILWLSWATHQRFDGLNTGGDHMVPQIAISFIKQVVDEEENIIHGSEQRYRVQIGIESPDPEVFAVMRLRVKPGSSFSADGKKILTDVFVQDVDKFKYCLTHKYEETHFIWKQSNVTPGEFVDSNRAHKLRRSARITAKKFSNNDLVKDV